MRCLGGLRSGIDFWFGGFAFSSRVSALKKEEKRREKKRRKKNREGWRKFYKVLRALKTLRISNNDCASLEVLDIANDCWLCEKASLVVRLRRFFFLGIYT